MMPVTRFLGTSIFMYGDGTPPPPSRAAVLAARLPCHDSSCITLAGTAFCIFAICLHNRFFSGTPCCTYPAPPPLKSPPPGEGETITSLFCWAIAVVYVPHLSRTRSCIAFPLLRISHLCVIL